MNKISVCIFSRVTLHGPAAVQNSVLCQCPPVWHKAGQQVRDEPQVVLVPILWEAEELQQNLVLKGNFFPQYHMMKQPWSFWQAKCWRMAVLPPFRKSYSHLTWPLWWLLQLLGGFFHSLFMAPLVPVCPVSGPCRSRVDSQWPSRHVKFPPGQLGSEW